MSREQSWKRSGLCFQQLLRPSARAADPGFPRPAPEFRGRAGGGGRAASREARGEDAGAGGAAAGPWRG